MGKPKINLDDFAEMLDFDNNFDPAIPTTEKEPGLAEMSLDGMEPFPDHKFKLYEGQKLADMAESIRQMGILLPLILWHTEDDRFIILSGHNRRNAAKVAGLSKAPVIIKEKLTMDEAVLIVTETNLHQRSFADMSHSERAYCLTQHYEALKSQGKRNDLLSEIEHLLNPDTIKDSETSAEVQHKLNNREKIGDEYGLSRDKVAKYIRIAKLIPSVLDKVDSGTIAFLSAYDLSFIENKELQQVIVDFMDSDDYKVDMKKAELLREYFEKGKLTEVTIAQILSGEMTSKPKSNKPKPIQIKTSVVSRYFTAGESRKEIEGVIEQALELFFKMQSMETEPDDELDKTI